MPTGISGLYKGTRGAIAHNKKKYEKEIKALAKKWKISFEKAYEVIMRRIDAGLPPLGSATAVKKAKPTSAKPESKKAVKAQEKAEKKAQKKAKKEVCLIGVEKEDADKICGIVEALGLPKPDAILSAKKLFESTAPAGNSPVSEKTEEFLEKSIDAEISAAVGGAHYDLPKPVNESIELIEMVMERENLPRKQAFCISQALRYLLRVGVKTKDWGKDIGKAENYLHRALHGEWIKGK